MDQNTALAREILRREQLQRLCEAAEAILQGGAPPLDENSLAHPDDRALAGRLLRAACAAVPRGAISDGGGSRVYIRTFGHFDVFVNERAILFNVAKAKELLALLVDRRGGFVSARDAIAFLWEDEPADATLMARYRKAAMHLKNILEKSGIGGIVEAVNGNRRAVPGAFRCDFYDYLDGKPSAAPYSGMYLLEYGWAEGTAAVLEVLRGRAGAGAPGPDSPVSGLPEPGSPRAQSR